MRADRWTPDLMPDLTGRTMVVTGATSGLGLATTQALTARGARVVLAVRDEAKARRAAGDTAEIRRLDLADLDSVREFAARLHDDHRHLDVLINNAGVMATPHTLSPQGHELQFATNHLGHFALTGLLLDLLLAGTGPRVVTVTSVNHRRARLPFLEPSRYSPMGAYNTTKLANAMFGYELHRRLSAANSPLSSILAHPGYTATNLQTSATTPMWRFLLGTVGNRLLAQPVARGAWPQLFAATAPGAQPGQLIAPDGPGELRGYPAVRELSAAATDTDNGRRLWELSEQSTGVRFGQLIA
ncbi:oxidoreductase [Actinoplanes aureus]|uniref:SDR family NAD(P)-dependent oxidoreductase n=1 Tax=Actinoplanes aureus TaxID=2792083 RepID=A0A931FXR0_9ACTN|nr:oxidoreductase [Actinoplanes aureus]MBG0563818.1 SDR family NAD(P)-dependent oxidoreductase [Actinoplanes aureus]